MIGFGINCFHMGEMANVYALNAASPTLSLSSKEYQENIQIVVALLASMSLRSRIMLPMC